MELNHTIIPVHDKGASARFFAEIMGSAYKGTVGHFAPVKVNSALTMDFDNAADFQTHHYAFKVSDSEFDSILARIQAADIAHGSGPRTPEDGTLNKRSGGRGFYWRDRDGHLMEVLTRDS